MGIRYPNKAAKAEAKAAQLKQKIHQRQKEAVLKCLLENNRNIFAIAKKAGCNEDRAVELVAEVQEEMANGKSFEMDNKTRWALMQVDHFVAEMWSLFYKSAEPKTETTVQVSPVVVKVIRKGNTEEKVYENQTKVVKKTIQRDPDPRYAALIAKGYELRARIDGTIKPVVYDEVTAIQKLIEVGALPPEVLDRVTEFTEDFFTNMKKVFRECGKTLTKADEEELADITQRFIGKIQDVKASRSGVELAGDAEVEVNGEEVENDETQ